MKNKVNKLIKPTSLKWGRDNDKTYKFYSYVNVKSCSNITVSSTHM